VRYGKVEVPEERRLESLLSWKCFYGTIWVGEEAFQPPHFRNAGMPVTSLEQPPYAAFS
jgi:hypothetical protein